MNASIAALRSCCVGAASRSHRSAGSHRASPRNAYGRMPKPSQPFVSRAHARQLVLHEAHDGDGIPLQPLRAVDREQLHDVVLGRLGARRELVELLGVVEPGEQARRATRSRRRRGTRAARRRTRAAAPTRSARARASRWRRARCRAAARARSAARARAAASRPPAAALRRRMPPRAAARRAAAVNPASQPWSGLWRSTKSRASTSEPPSSPALPRMRSTTSGASGCSAASCRAMRRASAASSRRSGSPIAQRGPASSRMSAEPALGSLSTRSADTTSTTSGVESSPPRPRMRCGMPRRPSASPKRTMCFLLRNRIAPVVGRARRRALGAHALEPLRDAVGLGVEVGVEAELDRRRAGAPGRGAQRLHGHGRRGRERREHGVRGIQHPRAVAPAGQQRELRARAVRARTPRRSRRGCRRSRRASRRSPGAGRRPPSRRCRAKSAASRSVCTTDVSWYSSSSTTRNRSRTSSATDRVRCARSRGAGDLVGEVDHADAALLGGVLAREVGEQRERADLLLGRRRRRRRRRSPLRVDGRSSTSRNRSGNAARSSNDDEVVDAVARDPQRRVDDAAHRLAARLEPRIVGGEHDAAHEQPRRRLRQDDGLGIPPDPHARARARSGRRSCCRSRPWAGAAARRRPALARLRARSPRRARPSRRGAPRPARAPSPERSSSPKTSRRPCGVQRRQVRHAARGARTRRGAAAGAGCARRARRRPCG